MRRLLAGVIDSQSGRESHVHVLQFDPANPARKPYTCTKCYRMYKTVSGYRLNPRVPMRMYLETLIEMRNAGLTK